MKVLVTGVSGFIGSSLAAFLLEQGHEVKGVFRRKDIPARLVELLDRHGSRLELVRMNLEEGIPRYNLKDPEIKAWKKAAYRGVPERVPQLALDEGSVQQFVHLLEGCDVVCHVAAFVFDWGGFDLFFNQNVLPVRYLLAASERRNVRMVQLSSISVMGFQTHRDSSEDGPWYKARHPYQVSKRMAESLARDARTRGLDVRVIRPGTVYGPGDTTTFYPLFDELQKGSVPFVKGGVSLTCPIHIDDLVSMLERLIILDLPDTTRLDFNGVNGEKVSWKHLLSAAADAIGARRPRISIPYWMAAIIAPLVESVYRVPFVHSAPKVTRYRVKQLGYDYHFSSQRAQTLLGWAPRFDFSEGIKTCAQAWKDARANE